MIISIVPTYYLISQLERRLSQVVVKQFTELILLILIITRDTHIYFPIGWVVKIYHMHACDTVVTIRDNCITRSMLALRHACKAYASNFPQPHEKMIMAERDGLLSGDESRNFYLCLLKVIHSIMDPLN